MQRNCDYPNQCTLRAASEMTPSELQNILPGVQITAVPSLYGRDSWYCSEWFTPFSKKEAGQVECRNSLDGVYLACQTHDFAPTYGTCAVILGPPSTSPSSSPSSSLSTQDMIASLRNVQ